MSLIAELRALRKGTAGFIAVKSFSLVLTPVLRVKTATGYDTQEQTPRLPQKMRLIDQAFILVGNNPGRLRSAMGEAQKATHMLLGEYDAQMAVGDFWVDSGARFEIDEIMPDNGYEQRAKVIRYGL
jgi:hypothetical protein